MDSSYPKKTEKEDNKIPIEIVQDDQALAAEFEKMTDAEDSAYLGDEIKLGDAFKTTSIDSYQVTDRSNKRLAEKVPALEKEIAQLKSIKNDGDGNEKKEKKGLINSIGKAFESISTKLETNIETILDDPGKRALFYAGTDMVDRASRITPISSGKAQSPFGMVVSGFGSGVKRVKSEELAKAKAEATKNKGNLKNQLDLLKLSFEMDEPSKLEIRSYDNLDKQFEDIQSAVSASATYNQQKKIS
jgi:hypothetical protein